jgi:hypothetical protein
MAALGAFGFWTTSSYARGEFKCNWVQDLAFLHRVADGLSRVTDIYDEIIKRLNKRPRRLQRCNEIVQTFLKRQTRQLSRKAELERFREFAAQAVLGADAVWEHSVHHEYNGTRCFVARKQADRAPNGCLKVSIQTCRRGNIRCEVGAFFEHNRETLARIAQKIDDTASPSGELRKVREAIRKAESDSGYLYDSTLRRVHCRDLADALIAVDGIQATAFMANNPAEWDLLAIVLGKDLVNPASRNA